jgi:predicted transcriptional regulator
MAISLRVPDEVKDRVEKLAATGNTSAHAFMVDAIREKVEAEEARASFYAEGIKRLAKMKKSGLGIPADEVFDYLGRRAKGEKPARPKPRKIS